MRKRQARARDLQEGAPRPMTLPRGEAATCSSNPPPKRPKRGASPRFNANGRRTGTVGRSPGPTPSPRPSLAMATRASRRIGRLPRRAEPADGRRAARARRGPVELRRARSGGRSRAGPSGARGRSGGRVARRRDGRRIPQATARSSARRAGRGKNVNLVEADALARGQDVEGAIAIDVALWGAAPVADDVAALAQFADRKGQGQLARTSGAIAASTASAVAPRRGSTSSPPWRHRPHEATQGRPARPPTAGTAAPSSRGTDRGLTRDEEDRIEGRAAHRVCARRSGRRRPRWAHRRRHARRRHRGVRHGHGAWGAPAGALLRHPERRRGEGANARRGLGRHQARPTLARAAPRRRRHDAWGGGSRRPARPEHRYSATRSSRPHCIPGRRRPRRGPHRRSRLARQSL